MADDEEFGVSDEELWDALAVTDADTKELFKDQDSIIRPRPYTFDFGKYQGLTFDEVPVTYIDWLVRNKINLDRENFRAALDKYRGMQKTKLQPVSPINPNPKRKRTFSETGLPSNPTLSKQHHSSPQDSGAGGTSPDLYRLTSGKHAGKMVEELPFSYIKWLMQNRVLKSNPDLASAIKQMTHSRLANWARPDLQDTNDPRFFDRDTKAPLRIAKNDVKKYFNIDEHLLSLAKIWPLFKRGDEYGLYPIFVCAQQFCTVKDGTADQALAKLLGRHNRGEHSEGSDQYYAVKLPNFTNAWVEVLDKSRFR